jgi:hypothetical protein
VKLEDLLERNETASDSFITNARTPCVYCHSGAKTGIRLNDNAFLCEACTFIISRISYPEKYENDRRQFLLEKEARRLAWEVLRGEFEHKSEVSVMVAIGLAALLLMWFDRSFFFLAAPIFAVGSVKNAINKRKTDEWIIRKTEWEQANPEPAPPELKHFHDPTAKLTEKDRQVLRVFNHWPGTPPFWSYLRSVVIERDSGRCQVTGCPSRLELHVHHMQSKSEGGAHSPSNLVTLCGFHHALEPASGHAGIWGDIRTLYFTLVCGHERSNRSDGGTHFVQAHLRRLRLVTLGEIKELSHVYGFRCPNCNGGGIEFSLIPERNIVRVDCPNCLESTEGAQQLTEETGPRLAEILAVSRNHGRWKARWDMLDERKSSNWRAWGRQTHAARSSARKRRSRR